MDLSDALSVIAAVLLRVTSTVNYPMASGEQSVVAHAEVFGGLGHITAAEE